jgi:hypothetical protein
LRSASVKLQYTVKVLPKATQEFNAPSKLSMSRRHPTNSTRSGGGGGRRWGGRARALVGSLNACGAADGAYESSSSASTWEIYIFFQTPPRYNTTP